MQVFAARAGAADDQPDALHLRRRGDDHVDVLDRFETAGIDHRGRGAQIHARHGVDLDQRHGVGDEWR